MHIQIKIINEKLRKLYETERKNFQSDSGFDLYSSEANIPAGARGYMLNLGVAVAAYESSDKIQSVPFMLVPRSSIVKTSFRLASGIGIIDRSYRGELKACVDVAGTCGHIGYGGRLFQIVAFDGSPITSEIVDQLDETDRGAGGHGSTGR